MSLPTIKEYVEGYELRGGYEYKPTDFEKFMIEDAIRGFLADMYIWENTAGKSKGDPLNPTGSWTLSGCPGLSSPTSK